MQELIEKHLPEAAQMDERARSLKAAAAAYNPAPTGGDADAAVARAVAADGPVVIPDDLVDLVVQEQLYADSFARTEAVLQRALDNLLNERDALVRPKLNAMLAHLHAMLQAALTDPTRYAQIRDAQRVLLDVNVRNTAGDRQQLGPEYDQLSTALHGTGYADAALIANAEAVYPRLIKERRGEVDFTKPAPYPVLNYGAGAAEHREYLAWLVASPTAEAWVPTIPQLEVRLGEINRAVRANAMHVSFSAESGEVIRTDEDLDAVLGRGF
ncbi:hypothetical protein [Nostocoides veronense]